MCVLRPSSPPVGATSLFPAKREVKREATKAWQAWPENQTSPRSLVRSLVCLAGRAPHPHVSKEVPDGASDRRGQCSQHVCEALVAARAAQPSASPPKNWSEKKSARNSFAPSLRKVIPKDGFRACRGLWKFLSEALKKSRRARQVPRGLPRGRGTAMPKRSMMSTFWASLTQSPRAYSPPAFHISLNEAQAAA